MKVDASRLSHLIDTLKASGADTETLWAVLAKSGLTRDDAAPTTKAIDYYGEVRFVREASRALGDVTFGARAGLTWHNSTGLVGYIGTFSEDLRAAIETTSRYHDIAGPALGWALRVAGNSAVLETFWKDASYAKYHRHKEFVMFGFLARMRSMTQTELYPVELRLDHDVGTAAREFRRLAGFPVVFGAEKMEMILPLSVLDLVIPTYNPSLKEHLLEYGNRLLCENSTGAPPLRSKVEGMLTAALPGRMPPAEEMAACLGMSPRTFSRRLKEDGITYRDIVEELRCDLSQTFLKAGMGVAEIAFALGYADQASFSTAFKRWTGWAPSQYA